MREIEERIGIYCRIYLAQYRVSRQSNSRLRGLRGSVQEDLVGKCHRLLD
jgi:hypothetical protein